MSLSLRPLSTLLLTLGLILCSLPLTSCRQLHGLTNGGNHHPWHMTQPVIAVENGARGRTVPCGIIEFDDQGQLWRDAEYKSQLPPVLDALRAAKRRGPVQLVLFVHGWNNNADPSLRKNLYRFQESLSAIDRTLDGTGMQTFGVFVSWRGQAQKMKIGLDYYNREASAIKIGRVEATAALQLLASTARQNSPRSLALGHSFGGVILLRAMAQPLADRLAEASVTGAPVKRSFADAVVIVNPADNSILARQLVSVLHDFKVRHTVAGVQVPLVVSVTSRTDRATGALYTFATGMGRYLFRPLMTHNAGKTVDYTQEKATITAIGHYTHIHSHDLKAEDAAHRHDHGSPPVVDTVDSEAGRIKKMEDLIRANTKPRYRGHGTDELVVWLDPQGSTPGTHPLVPHSLHRHSGATNQTPYWIFQCDSYIVKDHGDIWNANFTGLLTALQYAAAVETAPNRGRAAASRIVNKAPAAPAPACLHYPASAQLITPSRSPREFSSC